MLAVGGGGEQGYFSGGICHYSSGGGSGYVEYEEVSLLNDTVPQHFHIDVSVGERQGYAWKTTSASVTMTTKKNIIIVSADKGEEGVADGRGGDGYSGGGGHGRQRRDVRGKTGMCLVLTGISSIISYENHNNHCICICIQ